MEAVAHSSGEGMPRLLKWRPLLYLSAGGRFGNQELHQNLEYTSLIRISSWARNFLHWYSVLVRVFMKPVYLSDELHSCLTFNALSGSVGFELV
jgi:hypothetical protein